MIAFVALLAISALSSSAAAQNAETKNIQDMLPLSVGNSWTYQHGYIDFRANADGTAVSPQARTYAEITISILRTEVIDGETHYVFSEGPENHMPVDFPVHFIAGNKLRWDGNNLMEHDGTSAFSLYQFDATPTPQGTSWREYTISAHGDTLVKTRNSVTVGGLASQGFQFQGFSGWMSFGGWDPPDLNWSFGRYMRFAEHWGVRTCGDVIGWDGDTTVYRNELLPLRATLHLKPSGARGADDNPSQPVTIELDDYACASAAYDVQYGVTCNWPPSSTSNSSTSWGAVKEQR